MGVKFDYQTLDIFIDITQAQLLSLKRLPHATPVLEFQTKDTYFYLMNPESKKSISVMQPKTLDDNHYWIKINDIGYQQLLQTGQIGDRYDGEHKIDIRIEA